MREDDGLIEAEDARGDEQDLGQAVTRREARGPRRRRRRVWDFFHPPQAQWTAPGEQRARAVAGRMQQRLEGSRGRQIAVAIGALLLVVGMSVGIWAVLGPRPQTEAPEPASTPAMSTGADDVEGDDSAELPGAAAAGDAGQELADASQTQPPAGESADERTLKRINEGDQLVIARADDELDPLATAGRFVRSLRTVDTAEVPVGDWYEARDSFLMDPQGGGQPDWGEAGEKEADSRAIVSWAEMDAAIEEGRGIAPQWPYGSAAVPGTHLVQVGMRLEREMTVGGERVETPSGALMEVVVVCPPVEGVQRCVVTDWAEQPSDFVGLRDEAWEPIS